MRYLILAMTAGLLVSAAPAQYRATTQQVGGYGYYPAQKVIAQGVELAPLIVTVPINSQGVPVQAFGQPYYYSVTEAYRDKAYLREVIREELRAVIPGTTAPVEQPTTVNPPAGQPPLVPTQPATAGTLQPDDVTPPELQAKVLAAFQGRGGCINCHGPNSAKGGLRLALNDQQGALHLVKLSDDKRWKVYGMSSAGMMPPTAAADNNKTMEAANLPALAQWAGLKDR